jgi:phosphoribosylglycinamide formyltransferase-1
MSTFPLSRPARIAVLASGRGTNLQSILAAFPPGNPLATVALVVSNKQDAGALERARYHGIRGEFVPFGKAREQFEARVATFFEEEGIDLVCLAGFMRVLSEGFVKRFEGRILNIHPSLLPRFPGLDAPGQALRAGVNESGCTVHFVDAGIDTGPLIVQRSVPVLRHDTVATLSERILQEEHQAYPDAIRQVLTGQVRYEVQKVRS